MVNKKDIILSIFLSIMAIMLIFLYFNIERAENALLKNLQENKIKELSYILQNIEKLINQECNTENLHLYLKAHRDKKYEYDKLFGNFLTPNIKYFYMVYRDDRGIYRFLVDGSKEDKSHFNQRIEVSSKWDDVYNFKTEVKIIQRKIKGLWVTYLYPVMYNDRVIAVLALDFSTEIYKTTSKTVKPIKTFFLFLFSVMTIFLIITFIQMFRYFKARKDSITDPLTSLFNRVFLNEFLKTINISHYQIAMIDFDKFKSINDTYGHKAGDIVLKEGTKILKNSLRSGDVIIRYGGEEFLVFLLSRNKHRKDTFNIFNRIRNNVKKQIFYFDTNKINITISVGIHMHPEKERSIEDAIKITDTMLYEAKIKGRDRLEIYDTTDDTKRINLTASYNINDVKSALEEDRIVCFFQPIVDSSTKKTYKYEALVRIVTKDKKIIPPNKFLPYIKYTNIYNDVTKRVLQICFEQFLNTDEKVSINLSFIDFMNEDIVAFIISYLKLKEDLAKRVTFEILESEEIADIDKLKNVIEKLKFLGAKIAIDDFGSGYANFNMVLELEADILKIDGSLIKNINSNKRSFSVVKAIIAFAKEANLQVVAEYVSSKEVYEAVKKLDIEYMQGYYFSKPLSQKELLKRQTL